MRSMKKVLAATLAATMVMASAMTVCATTQSAGSGSETQESTALATYAEAKSQAAGASIKVGGVAVQTSIAGVYAAETVNGVAVTTPAAMVSVNAAIEALGGGELTAVLNVDLGAKQNGKWVTLSNGSVAMKAGLPKTADTRIGC